MIEQLVPVVAVPALITAAWVTIALRLIGSPLWLRGGLLALVVAAILVVIAAFLPLVGPVGALAVPVLCVGGGALLLLLFARLHAVAVALSIPFALLITLQPPLFPFLMPLVLTVPLWTAGWLDREGDVGRYALTVLASVIAVPVAVFGAFFLLLR